MARTPQPNDFTVTLAGVGDFTFARRTVGDMIRIRTDYLRLVGELESDAELAYFCGFVAAYRHLIVACPAGWEDAAQFDVNGIGMDKIIELADLLAEKEASFRGSQTGGGPASGA